MCDLSPIVFVSTVNIIPHIKLCIKYITLYKAENSVSNLSITQNLGLGSQSFSRTILSMGEGGNEVNHMKHQSKKG